MLWALWCLTRISMTHRWSCCCIAGDESHGIRILSWFSPRRAHQSAGNGMRSDRDGWRLTSRRPITNRPRHVCWRDGDSLTKPVALALCSSLRIFTQQNKILGIIHNHTTTRYPLFTKRPTPCLSIWTAWAKEPGQKFSLDPSPNHFGRRHEQAVQAWTDASTVLHAGVLLFRSNSWNQGCV